MISTVLACILFSGLRSADLFFVVEKAAGAEGMSGAIIEATSGLQGDSEQSCSSGLSDELAGAGFSATHVGIIECVGDSVFVFDAYPGIGVSRRPLEVFEGERLVFMRLKQPVDTAAVLTRARSLLGLEYDLSFMPGNDKYYCSEFVQECFGGDAGLSGGPGAGAAGTPGEPKAGVAKSQGKPTTEAEGVFASKPMNFKDKDGNFPAYWTDLFSRLGIPIPQGVPGTNPQDMLTSGLLERVH